MVRKAGENSTGKEFEAAAAVYTFMRVEDGNTEAKIIVYLLFEFHGRPRFQRQTREVGVTSETGNRKAIPARNTHSTVPAFG